ncbi:MAG TPA: peptide chain release factor N(5)-glutamine methyltransferase [Rhodanobacteraceae bacterium]|nr:peptide chain release factor N(5)-glutamine methyltransferase [Rhodanobacteraceae bacterium]
MRARDLLAAGTRALSGAEARLDAELLLTHVLGVSRAWLVAHADDEVAGAYRAAFEALIARRARGEPVAYLTGVRGFHTLDLHVTPDVLIPRPETELLVELALARIPSAAKGQRGPDEARRNPDATPHFAPDSVSFHPGYRIADLGTGSGAIALAIARARPDAQVLATDASSAALAIARENAQQLNLTNVEFAQGDWCAALGDARDFDLIVSNPPYIAEGDPHLREGDLRFEPRAALASGPDGLDAIRTIVRDARSRLREAGWLLLEHGFEQGTAVRALLEQSGYHEVFTERDLGTRERVSGGMIA